MKRILYFLYKIKIWMMAHFYVLFPSKGTYDKLHCYSNVFTLAQYIKVRDRIFRNVERTIQKKREKSVRIIMVDSTEWATDQIYDYLFKRGIDIAVVLTPFINGKDESVKKAYDLCREFCESKKIRYLDAYDPESGELFPEFAHDIYGDVMIYTNPWMGAYPAELNVKNVALSSITCYIPYGFMLAKQERDQFNQRSHNMFAHIYCETKIHWQMYAEYCDIGNFHVEYAGYPKMDWYLKEQEIDEGLIWKGVSDKERKIKIIYSPHWIVGKTGTFMDNGLQILKYAEEHTQTTSWIYKPHPLLEREMVAWGYMSAKDYSEYVARWERLPNARVFLTGDYSDMFLSSDCIINDSVSFIAEYMYTHKPMLLLSNGLAEYNDFGQECMKYLYICDSKDIVGIEKFIEDVMAGKDELRSEREKFFSKYLDYYNDHGESASEYIIHQICNMIGI